MKKGLMSILLAACMVFSAGRSAVYAAETPDQAKEEDSLPEDGERQEPGKMIQKEEDPAGGGDSVSEDVSVPESEGMEKTQYADPVSEDVSAQGADGTELKGNLAEDGDTKEAPGLYRSWFPAQYGALRNGYISEVMAADRDDFITQYRALMVQRQGKFRITVPLEAKMKTIDDCVPASAVFNDEDFNSWENSQCFYDYPTTISYEGYKDEDDGLVVYLRNIVSYHLAEGHSDQQSIILTFPDKIPDGVDIEIDGMPAELNDDRTKAKTIGNYPTQTYESEYVKIRVKFIGLHKSDIAYENPILLRSWLLSSEDIYAHNGVPYEGDYLRRHLDGTPDIYVWDPVITGIDEASHTYYYDLTVDCSAVYYSTGDMEDEVAAEIDQVLADMDLGSKSEYEKIKAIHDFICRNTEYKLPEDGDDPPMLKHSAYSALIQKKAVADGYAGLFYRMCLQAGIDARIVYGYGKEDQHAWNIVKLGSLYYDVDCTWDADSSTEYFLMGHSQFLEDHTLFPEFTESEFLEAYPMSESRYSLPTFETYSLILGGRIGLNMMMNLPDNPEFDYDNSYMEFKINGGEPIRQEFDPGRKNRNGTLFKFTCYVNSLQMADDITAVFHYLDNGEEQQVSAAYTIEQYLRTLSDMEGVSDEAKALAEAIADFGYHVQPYLADIHDLDLEGENALYKRMTFHVKEGYQDKIAEILESLDLPDGDKTSDIRKISMSLLLDSDTSIHIFFYTDPAYTGTVKAVLDNMDVEAEEVSKGKYKVVIPGINAANLNKKYKVVLTTDSGNSTVNVSALNYVKIALSKTDPEATGYEKQAMGSVYYYYKAAKAYAETLTDH